MYQLKPYPKILFILLTSQRMSTWIPWTSLSSQSSTLSTIFSQLLGEPIIFVSPFLPFTFWYLLTKVRHHFNVLWIILRCTFSQFVTACSSLPFAVFFIFSICYSCRSGGVNGWTWGALELKGGRDARSTPLLGMVLVCGGTWWKIGWSTAEE